MTSRLTTLRLVACALITGAGLWAMGLSSGQEAAVPPGGADLPVIDSGSEVHTTSPGAAWEMAAEQLRERGRFDEARKLFDGARTWPQQFAGNNLLRDLHIAAAAYRDAKDDEAKAAAQKKLAELLGKYFDEDMARRQAEVTKVEERLAKLRELLDRRQGKKQEIVELQTKVVLNEADGLGFYDGPLTELREEYMRATSQQDLNFGHGGSGSTGTTYPGIDSASGIPAPAADLGSDPLAAPTPTTDAAPAP